MMLEFYCVDCYYQFLFYEGDDPTSSTGCCKSCGSDDWVVKETNLSETEYFKHKLKGGTFGYRTGRVLI